MSNVSSIRRRSSSAAPSLEELGSLIAAQKQQLEAQHAQLAALQAQLEGAAPSGRARAQDAKAAAEDAALLAVVRGRSIWLPEAQKAAKLSKQIATTAAKRLAAKKQVWLSQEPGPTGHLTWRLRSLERVATED